MPTEFLTDEQEQAYGHYFGPPSTQQLSRYFHLDDADRERVNERCGADNKLGFAVQLTTVRFLGTFLAEPTDVPSDVVAYVAAQLGIRCCSSELKRFSGHLSLRSLEGYIAHNREAAKVRSPHSGATARVPFLHPGRVTAA